MSQALPPLVALRQFDTVRLVPSRFADLEDSVLKGIAHDDAHLSDLFELDNATNARLAAESGRPGGIGVEELVAGIPNFRSINAAYCYAQPLGSRFNSGTRGAWYASFDAQTALAEVIFHKTVEYAEINRFDDSVDYQAFLADFNADFHDLRGSTAHSACLDAHSYIASQALAGQLLEQGSLGLLYPSVRHPAGTHLACFRPALVGHVRKGDCYQLRWTGSSMPLVHKRDGVTQ